MSLATDLHSETAPLDDMGANSDHRTLPTSSSTWQPARSHGSRQGGSTLIIFDWDDTLLPTAWLQRQDVLHGLGGTLLASQQKMLRKLAKSAAATLSAAKRLGKVVIVTNAWEGWVEKSCARFLPALMPVLRGVAVFSARAAFDNGARSPADWKCHMFSRTLAAFFSRGGPSARQFNVVSVGDSVHEQNAIFHSTDNFPGCFAKSLKFMDHPKVEELIGQHDLVRGVLAAVVAHEGDLDIEVSLEYPSASDTDHTP